MSLGGILAYADRHAPSLAVARSTRSRAEAARAGAAPLLTSNPTLTVAAGPRFGDSGTGVDVEASLTQPVGIAGVRRARLDAAESTGELTDAEIERVRWDVHCDVHALFHLALVARARKELGARIVTFQEDILRIVGRRIAAGEAAPLALRLAEAEVAQAKQNFVAAEQGYYAARVRLAQESGWPVSAPPLPEGDTDEARDPPRLEQLVSLAEEHQPALRAAAVRVQKAEADVVVEKRSVAPQPSLGVSYRREGNPSTEGPYDIVMGVVSTPIPSFQTNQAGRAEAEAELTVARAELHAARRLLEGQLAEARSLVDAAAARTRAYRAEIVPRFEENLAMLARAFELGEVDLLALSSGRERFLRIQEDALGAEQGYFVALAGLERMVGVELWHDEHEGRK